MWHLGIGVCFDWLQYLLGQSVTLNDLEDMDAELHKNLLWTLNNDVSDLDLYFEASQRIYDKVGSSLNNSPFNH